MRTRILNLRFEISNSKSLTSGRRDSQKGYLLLSLMLLITIMLIMLAIEAPRIAQQIKREKEDELIFRGKEYATAIKRFYHKNGTYPLSLEQLEDTNHLRFLRKRYKDPMTTEGEWKLIHVGEAQLPLPTLTGGAPGQTGTLATSPLGGTVTPSPTPGGLGGGGAVNIGPGGLGGGGLAQGGAGLGGGLGQACTGLGGGCLGLGGTALGSGAGPAGGTQPGPGGQMGTLTTQNIGTGTTGSTIGGGPIMGVASTSTKTSIKEFNGNDEYDEWLFVYDPRREQFGGGVIIAAPRTGSTPPPPAPGPAPSGSPTPGAVPAPAPQASPGVRQ
jgi:type II secretory pathway pseudopilin PulG